MRAGLFRVFALGDINFREACFRFEVALADQHQQVEPYKYRDSGTNHGEVDEEVGRHCGGWNSPEGAIYLSPGWNPGFGSF